MKYLFTLLCISLMLFGTGAIYFAKNLTPAVFAISQETAKLKAETKLEKAKSERIEQSLNYKIKMQSLRNQKQAQNTRLYIFSLALASSFSALWPFWLVMACVGLFVTQKRRIEPQVEFAVDGIQTILPAKKAEAMTLKALQYKELKASAEILAFEEETTQRKVKESINIARSLNIGLREPKTAVIETQVEDVKELPAFSGTIHYSQLIQDAGYEEGLIPLGRDIETGNIIQIDFERLQSCVKLGKQGFGKSTAAKLELLTALELKYVEHENIRIHLIDKQAGMNGSLASDIQPILSLLDTTILGPAAQDHTLLDFLDTHIKEASEYQTGWILNNGNVQQPLPYFDIIIFDEFTETIARHPEGKRVEKKVMELLNLRKFKKFLSLLVYDGSKGDNSGKGVSVAKMGASAMVFNSPEYQARALLGKSEYVRQVETLREGQAIVKLSKQRHAGDPPVVLCQVALVSDTDFLRYTPYIDIQNAPQATHAPNSQKMIDDTPATSELTPEHITAYIQAKKQKEAKYSQNKFAQDVHVNKSRISQFMNGKLVFTDEENNRVHKVIFARKQGNVYYLKQSGNA